mmetsp:Transcript_28359/g.90404  ORF Transcript_28359/g.90404 Transcript_28359/m.90404 type:complete len:219 (+) Transcript_28359:128-784(+)
MTATPCRRFQQSRTCAGVIPASAATRTTVASLRSCRPPPPPPPSGVWACSAMRSEAQNSSRSHWGRRGCRSTWFTAGLTEQQASSWRSTPAVQLHTPMRSAWPAATASSNPRQVAARAPSRAAWSGQCRRRRLAKGRFKRRRLAVTAARTAAAPCPPPVALLGTLTIRYAPPSMKLPTSVSFLYVGAVSTAAHPKPSTRRRRSPFSSIVPSATAGRIP